MLHNNMQAQSDGPYLGLSHQHHAQVNRSSNRLLCGKSEAESQYAHTQERERYTRSLIVAQG